MNNNDLDTDVKKGKLWNYIIGGISLINVLFAVLYFIFYNKSKHFNATTYTLMTIYIIACCVRSLFPVVESSRKCLNKSKIVTPVVTRSLATVAEISFSILIAICFINVIKEVSKYSNEKQKFNILKKGFIISVVFITIAQMNCWAGITTQNAIYNTIEESIWATYGVYILIASCLILTSIKNENKKLNLIKPFLVVSIIVISIYVLFMIMVDVPMYYNRYKNSTIKKENLIIKFRQLFKCDIVSNKYSDWSEEVPWMSSYFLGAVWASIILYFFNNKIR